jgi:hypothetical protein
MKLKELFDKYTFDDILPYLREIEPERGDSMYQFREALDLLKRMEPSKEECGDVRIEWSQDEYDEDRYISVHPLEGVCWDEGLAKEVVVAEDLQLDEKDVAAHCLWSITFWGFGDEPDPEDEGPFDYPPKHRNKYDEALYRIQFSHWKHTTPRKYRSKTFPLCTDVEFCMKRIRCNTNRIKRKRDYRVECRENYLKKHSQRENFIMKLTRCGAFQREDVEYLHQVEEGQYYPYDSRTWDESKRIDYILESINKYQDVDFSQFDDAIICLRASSEYPVTEAEKDKLLAGLPESLKAMPIKIGLGTQESMKQEVEMMLFLNVIR